jgi:hypothetical protein
MKTVKYRVWDRQGKYIGKFELPESRPNIVRFGSKNIFTYNTMHNVFIETEVYEVGRLETTDVPNNQNTSK